MRKSNYVVLLLLIFVFLCASCATTTEPIAVKKPEKVTEPDNRKYSKDHASEAITKDLTEKAYKADAYAHTIAFLGQKQKRMFFRFMKDGRPHYSFRSEYELNGQPYIYLYNIDGFDYECYPAQQTAYRTPTDGNWNESNYGGAKLWHFDYKKASVIGEDKVKDEECYILAEEEGESCLSKTTGHRLYMKQKNGTMFYEDMTTDVADEQFTVPPFLKVVDKAAPKKS